MCAFVCIMRWLFRLFPLYLDFIATQRENVIRPQLSPTLRGPRAKKVNEPEKYYQLFLFLSYTHTPFCINGSLLGQISFAPLFACTLDASPCCIIPCSSSRISSSSSSIDDSKRSHLDNPSKILSMFFSLPRK